MCALKTWAATGGSTNPITSAVTTASGRRTGSDSAVLNRISEKMGASARPKNAVFR